MHPHIQQTIEALRAKAVECNRMADSLHALFSFPNGGIVAIDFRDKMRQLKPDAKLTDFQQLANVSGSSTQAGLDAFSDKLDKAIAEIQAEVQALKDSLKDQTLSPETQASFDRLGAKVQAVDDLNPDQP